MSKVKVRYIGSGESALMSSRPEVPSIQFNRYGQLVEMDEGLFKAIIRGDYGAKLAIMLDEDFQQIGHTHDELTKFGNPDSHKSAPQDFTAKVEAANNKLMEVQAAAVTPAPQPEEAQ